MMDDVWRPSGTHLAFALAKNGKLLSNKDPTDSTGQDYRIEALPASWIKEGIVVYVNLLAERRIPHTLFIVQKIRRPISGNHSPEQIFRNPLIFRIV
jgi:hypothetical protein